LAQGFTALRHFLLELLMMMLRHKPTGDIFVYTELLSRREDMEVFEQNPTLPPAPQTAKLKATATPVVVKARPNGDAS
jgi:hypothetical protein